MKLQKGINLMENAEIVEASQAYCNRIRAARDPIARAFLDADYVFNLRRLYAAPISRFTDAIVRDPNDAMAFFFRGLSFLIQPVNRVRDFRPTIDEAMSCFNSSILLDRKNPLPWFGRAKAWFYKGEYHEALEDAETAVALNEAPSPGIDYQDFLNRVKNMVDSRKHLPFNIGKIGSCIKEDYEENNPAKRVDGWKHIDWEHRFKIHEGALIRSYVQPCMDPDEPFFTEYVVARPPHLRISTYYKARGREFEMIEMADGSEIETFNLFNGEVWIEESTLRHPIGTFL